MRNPRFKTIRPNYRKRLLEITLQEGRKTASYGLPFSLAGAERAGTDNRFAAIDIDKELDSQGASFALEDGTEGSFPADLVLYYCDPSYDWSPVNQLKRSLRDKLARKNLSIRVLAAALDTSPTQVVRLLEENRASKHLLQLLKLAELAGYRLEFRLRKKPAA